MDEKSATPEVASQAIHSEIPNHIENLGDFASQNKYAVKSDDSDGKIPMTFRRFLAMLFLYMTFAGANLPLFFTVGSLAYIEKDVKNTATRGWAGTAYGISLAALVPFCGYLQDLFGRRYFTILGSLLLCVGLIIIGTTHSFTQLMFGLVISGFGAAISELTATAGLAEVVSVKNRGITLAGLTVFILPFAPYVLYSELLGAHATWRWSMWLSLIWNGIVLVGLTFTYFPKSHRRGDSLTKAEAWKQIDFMGGFLSVASTVLFLVALQSGGAAYPWTNAKVLVPLILGILLAISFVLWEWKGASYPMVPASIFKGQRVVGPSLVLSFAIGMDLFAVLTFMPLAFGTIYDPDPREVGLKSLGYGFGQTVGATVGNIFMTLLKNNQRENLAAGCVMMATFIGSLAVMNPGNPTTTIILTTIAGWSVGWVISPISTIALSGTPDMFIATVVGLQLASRYVGGSVGYSIYYAIFTSKLKGKLPNYIAIAVAEAGLPVTQIPEFLLTFTTQPNALSSLEGITPAILQAATMASKTAYADSLRYVWYTSIPFGVICVITVFFMKSTTKFVTNRVAATLE